jgi:hypothetical protein
MTQSFAGIRNRRIQRGIAVVAMRTTRGVSMSRSKEQWSRILEGFDDSGMSQQAYAERSGLNVATFRYQLYRRAKLRAPAAESATVGRFQEVSVGAARVSGEPCRLRVDASGVHVTGGELPSAEWVAALVRGLSSC